MAKKKKKVRATIHPLVLFIFLLFFLFLSTIIEGNAIVFSESSPSVESSNEEKGEENAVKEEEKDDSSSLITGESAAKESVAEDQVQEQSERREEIVESKEEKTDDTRVKEDAKDTKPTQEGSLSTGGSGAIIATETVSTSVTSKEGEFDDALLSSPVVERLRKKDKKKRPRTDSFEVSRCILIFAQFRMGARMHTPARMRGT